MNRDFGRIARLTLMVAGTFVPAPALAQDATSSQFLPYFPVHSDVKPQGFLRILNESDRAGTLSVQYFNDARNRTGGQYRREIAAGEVLHYDSRRFSPENFDSGAIGITEGGQGDRWLEVKSDLNLQARAYVRTPEGALAEMYETAPREGTRYRVAFFNPGSNGNQVSLLRLSNTREEHRLVRILGTDDQGNSPDSELFVSLDSAETRTYTAAQLESGDHPGLTNSLGEGVGKWRLDLEIDGGGGVLVTSLLWSPTGHLTNLSTVPSSQSGGVHRVPLFPPASDLLRRQGFARVVNHSDRAGQVRIRAFDDTPWAYESVTLSIGAGETAQFNSEDLEFGNAKKGLTGSTGSGQGNWRLELTSELDIEVLSYVRLVGGYGYVTPMHDTAVREAGGLMRYYVPIFHPESHEGQESRLHLFNPGDISTRVGISGRDDAGEHPPEGDVSLTLDAGETRVLTARQLESGDEGLDGKFGTGSGWWQLYVTADAEVQAMSLGYSDDGFIANLSRNNPATDGLQFDPVEMVVEAPSVGRSDPGPGDNFSMSTRVRNRSAVGSGATTLNFYRSRNASISGADAPVATTRVPALAPSGVRSATVTLSAPPTPGTYYYGVCVDGVPGAAEAFNNCSSPVRITVE